MYCGILGYCYLVKLCPKACENAPKYRIFNTNNHFFWVGAQPSASYAPPPRSLATGLQVIAEELNKLMQMH